MNMSTCYFVAVTNYSVTNYSVKKLFCQKIYLEKENNKNPINQEYDYKLADLKFYVTSLGSFYC